MSRARSASSPDGFRILRLDEREQPRRHHWLCALAPLLAAAPADATIYKRDKRSIVFAARTLGRDLIVKRHRLTPHDRLRLLFGSGRGLGQWRGTRLLTHGLRPIRAARALLVAATSKAEVLVLEHIPGPTLLEVLAGRSSHTPRQRHALAFAVGSQVAHIAASGLRNRDHKPSNIIAADAEPTVIDAVGVRRHRGGPEAVDAAIVEMCVCLMLEPIGCTCPPTSADIRGVLLGAWSGLQQHGLRPPMPRHRWCNQVARRVEAAIASHGDPTPAINPLARATPGG